MRSIAMAALCMVSALAGCSKAGRPPSEPEPARVSGERALEEVRAFVALGLRDAGTPGAERAAEYLRARLAGMGCAAEVDAFADRCPRGEVTFRNVTATLPGEGEGLVVLGSHYDTKAGLGPEFQGANDSGSSTGLLLELARVLAGTPRGRPEVLVAFFDGEECMENYGPHDGLHGSRRLARVLKESGRAARVRAVVVLDMVGDRDLTVTVPPNGTPWLAAAVFDAARAEGVRTRFALGERPILDDHAPFLEAGLPAVDLIDFAFGSMPGQNDYWHTTQDSMDKLSASSLEVVGGVVLRLVRNLAAGIAVTGDPK